MAKEYGCNLRISWEKDGKKLYTCMRGFVGHFKSDADDDSNDCKYVEKRASYEEICTAVNIFKMESKKFDYQAMYKKHKALVTTFSPKNFDGFSKAYKKTIEAIYGTSFANIKDLCLKYSAALFEENDFDYNKTLSILESELYNIIDNQKKRFLIEESKSSPGIQEALDKIVKQGVDVFSKFMPDEDKIEDVVESKILETKVVETKIVEIPVSNMFDKFLPKEEGEPKSSDNPFAHLFPGD